MLRVVRVASVLPALLAVAGPRAVRAESWSIDPQRSILQVFVDKSGLFSALADNHVIRAPISEGHINDAGDLAVELTVSSSALTVMDPGLSADKRDEVAARMHGPDVLDSASYPTIRFVSQRVNAE